MCAKVMTRWFQTPGNKYRELNVRDQKVTTLCLSSMCSEFTVCDQKVATLMCVIIGLYVWSKGSDFYVCYHCV